MDERLKSAERTIMTEFTDPEGYWSPDGTPGSGRQRRRG